MRRLGEKAFRSFSLRIASNLFSSDCSPRVLLPIPTVTFYLTSKGKGKSVPLQAWSGPEGSRKLRFPDFKTTAQDGGRLSAFLLEAQSILGPLCNRKDFMPMKNPLIPAGIEPATFRFVTQHLNHCREKNVKIKL